jgi:hypothetical protein
MGGNGVPDGWKRYPAWVEMVCRMGGKGIPDGWKWCARWVEKVSLGVEIVFNTSRMTIIRMQTGIFIEDVLIFR